MLSNRSFASNATATRSAPQAGGVHGAPLHQSGAEASIST